MKDKNKTYHDYVIKDGKFIGKFDEMYNEFSDPWTQSAQPNKYSRMAGIIHVKNFNIKSILECGCGLGFYADWIKKETNITPKSIDISAVAIEKAKKLFPNLDFEIANISTDLHKFKNYEAILLSEII
ncbi:MAG: nodulation protein S NodS, partial [Bacteroidota bacterium]